MKKKIYNENLILNEINNNHEKNSTLMINTKVTINNSEGHFHHILHRKRENSFKNIENSFKNIENSFKNTENSFKEYFNISIKNISTKMTSTSNIKVINKTSKSGKSFKLNNHQILNWKMKKF